MPASGLKLVLIFVSGCGLLFFLLPFLYAFAFCFPAGDDFDEASRAMFLFDVPGGVYEIGREWLTWSGRYTYHFLAVFLAKAAESRVCCGILCASCLFLYGTGVGLLGRANRRSWPCSLFFGALFLLALCVCWQYLPVFYLQTDALTSGLQGAAWLIFFALTVWLWQEASRNSPNTKKIWRWCLGLGIFAIGLYEHAALAVLYTCLAALVLSFLVKAQNRFLHTTFLYLCLWLLGFLLLSFMAPGNFQRQLVRGAAFPQTNLILVAMADWLLAMKEFFSGLWAPFTVLLALIWRLTDTPMRREHTHTMFFCLMVLVTFVCFSFSLAILHAASDMPLSSAVKLRASLGFYAACAMAIICDAIFQTVPEVIFNRIKLWLAAFALAGCFALAWLSTNFQQTAINAANGQMELYGKFMMSRYACLSKAGADVSWRRFGIAGEIGRGGKRKTDAPPQWPKVVVPMATFLPYPFGYEDTLQDSADKWPNPWAAWLYGLAEVEARLPDVAGAISAALAGHATEMVIPRELAVQGVEAAWRLNAPFCANSCFSVNWLIVQTAELSADTIAILRPNPVNSERLAPIWLQREWLECLLSKDSSGFDLEAQLAASCLVFRSAQWRKGNFYALPLAVEWTADLEKWPDPVFVNLTGGAFFKIMPFVF